VQSACCCGAFRRSDSGKASYNDSSREAAGCNLCLRRTNGNQLPYCSQLTSHTSQTMPDKHALILFRIISGIKTRHETNSDLIPHRCKKSPKRPDHLWDPPGLLLNAYRGLFSSGVKWPAVFPLSCAGARPRGN
jgi:hypothetical protein